MPELTLTPGYGDAWLSKRHRVYMIHGEDGKMIADAVEALRQRVVEPANADFDLDELDAETVTINEIIGSVMREPLLGDTRAVVVRSCESFRRRERSRDADRLSEAIAGLGDRSCLVLVKAADEPGGRKAATALTAKLDAAVKAGGLMVRCPALDASGLAEWMATYAARAGKEISRGAAARLSQMRSGDRVALCHELEKVMAYVGDRPRIEVADVEAVTSENPEDVMFRLVDAVSARKTAEALVLLRKAIRFESRAQTLAGRFLSLLSRQLRFVYQARELDALGIRASAVGSAPTELTSQLPSEGSLASMAWKARSYARDAAHWPRKDLVQAMRLIMECDAANKGDQQGSEDPVANLETLIVRLCDRGIA